MRYLLAALLALVVAQSEAVADVDSAGFGSIPASPFGFALRSLSLDIGPSLRVQSAPSPDELNFDLLGEPAQAMPAVDESRMKLRRTMLKVHQGLGIGLLAAGTAMMVFGQLSYNDRFVSGAATGKYDLCHSASSYGTLGLFSATGLTAILAPSSGEGWFKSADRATLHRVSMLAATAGMAAQAVLGILTVRREGYRNQAALARAHLAVGYATYASMLLGVGVLVF